MHPTLARTLGFFVPTLIVIGGQHVAAQPTLGEALDGFVSSAWFTLLFAAGTLIAHRVSALRSAVEPGSTWRDLRGGALAGMVCWLLLWAFWALPATRSLREIASFVFPFNCAWALLCGLLAQPWARGRAHATA